MADIDISAVTRRKTFSGSAGTGPYACTFEITDEEDIAVYKDTTLLTLTTDYTVSIAGNGTFSVTLVVAATGSNIITVIGAKSIARSSEFSTGGDFFAATVNSELDALVIFIQQVLDRAERALKAHFSDDIALDMTLPATATRASKYLAFDADGAPVATAGTTSSQIISTFAETLLDDTDAATMRATIDAQQDVFTTRGDLVRAGASGVAERVALGTTGQVLTSDGTDAVWANPQFTTGDVKLTLKTTADTGWVLMNDTTIGNASSGATGRANADTADLFTLLWNNTADAQCAVSTGRGASAAADYAANKTIALPKALGRALATYGAGSGLTSRALALATGSEDAVVVAHTHGYGDATATAGGVSTLSRTSGSNQSSSTGESGTGKNMQPTLFLNTMIKL